MTVIEQFSFCTCIYFSALQVCFIALKTVTIKILKAGFPVLFLTLYTLGVEGGLLSPSSFSEITFFGKKPEKLKLSDFL